MDIHLGRGNANILMNRLLLDTDLAEEQKKLTKIAMASGKSLLTIINDILDLSKLESGKLKLEETDFDILQVINGVQSLLGDRVKLVADIAKDIEIRVPTIQAAERESKNLKLAIEQTQQWLENFA